MRTTILAAGLGVFVLLATPSPGRAQHKPRTADDLARSYNDGATTVQDQIDEIRKQLEKPNLSMADAAKLIGQQSALRARANALWDKTQMEIDDSFKATRNSIVDYNAKNQRLGIDSAVVSSEIDKINNVAKYPTREEFEKNKARMSQDWDQNYGSRLKPLGQQFAEDREQIFKDYNDKYGIDLKTEGYSRIGEYNPYTGQFYYKYYDKDGNRVPWAQYTKDLEGLEKFRQDVETYRRRQADQKAQLEKQATGLTQLQDKVDNSRKTLRPVMESQRDRLATAQVVGSWKGVSVQGTSKLNIDLVFKADGTVTNRAENGQTGNGKWTRAGDTITVTWSTGAKVSWQMKDGQLGGSGTTSRGQPWSISFSKQ